MTDNVVDLKARAAVEEQKPDTIWCCGQCDCVQFLLHGDNTIECAMCHERKVWSEGRWHETLVEDPTNDRTATRETLFLGAANLAKAATLKVAKEEGVETVVVVWKNDRVRVWHGDYDSPEVETRVRKNLGTAIDLILTSLHGVHDK